MKHQFHIRTVREEMERTGLELPRICPIRVWDHQPGGGTWALPSLSHMEAIPTLWIVLHQIVDDWKRYAGEYSYSNVGDPHVSRNEYLDWALEELKPRFINCLFSYINFFCLLENGFGVMFSEIKGVARELDLSIYTPKRPKRNEYLERLILVRNNTVVHWGGPDKKHEIDSRAGRLWGSSLPDDSDTLEDISFGVASLVGAQDRKLGTLAETHAECTAHLRNYDVACAGML